MGGHRIPIHVCLASTSGAIANLFHCSLSYKSKLPQKCGTVQQVYQCCQTTASSHHHQKKARTESGTVRDARRMRRFDCKGLFYMTLRAGYIDCVLKHQLDHIRYKDIRIPDKWCQFILDNHKLGPAKVRAHLCLNSVTEWAV